MEPETHAVSDVVREIKALRSQSVPFRGSLRSVFPWHRVSLLGAGGVPAVAALRGRVAFHSVVTPCLRVAQRAYSTQKTTQGAAREQGSRGDRSDSAAITSVGRDCANANPENCTANG